MKVTVKLKSTSSFFENVWKVYSNNKDKELVLVGYDHMVLFRDKKENVETILIE